MSTKSYAASKCNGKVTLNVCRAVKLQRCSVHSKSWDRSRVQYAHRTHNGPLDAALLLVPISLSLLHAAGRIETCTHHFLEYINFQGCMVVVG